MAAILHMTLVRKYFRRIAKGVKKEEYRALTDYWARRLEGKRYDFIRFRNGYAKDAPLLDVQFKGVRKESDCYVIELGEILAYANWPGMRAMGHVQASA